MNDRIFALLEIRGEQALVTASNDEALRGRTIPWINAGDRLTPVVLNALDLNVAMHRPFETGTKHWVLVFGARSESATPPDLDEWTVQLVRQLAEQQDRESSPAEISQDTETRIDNRPYVLCFQPVFDVVLRKATHAEALLRYRSPEGELLSWPEFTRSDARTIADADRWVLHQSLQRAAQWSEKYGIRSIHVNLTLHEGRELEALLGMLRAVGPSDRKAIAIEINGVSDYAAPRFVQMAEALAQAGTSVGLELAGQTAIELALLRRLPISFVKVDSDTHAAQLAEVFRWDVFLTRVQGPPQWDDLRQHGVKYAQGYALESPLTVADFSSWLEARVTPAAVLVG